VSITTPAPDFETRRKRLSVFKCSACADDFNDLAGTSSTFGTPKLAKIFPSVGTLGRLDVPCGASAAQPPLIHADLDASTFLL
jgi:hypothetical protein